MAVSQWTDQESPKTPRRDLIWVKPIAALTLSTDEHETIEFGFCRVIGRLPDCAGSIRTGVG
jgi:hypothetical protein